MVNCQLATHRHADDILKYHSTYFCSEWFRCFLLEFQHRLLKSKPGLAIIRQPALLSNQKKWLQDIFKNNTRPNLGVRCMNCSREKDVWDALEKLIEPEKGAGV